MKPLPTPTVGRIIHVQRSEGWVAAIVTVVGLETFAVTVFLPGGALEVDLLHYADNGGTWRWPPREG